MLGLTKPHRLRILLASFARVQLKWQPNSMGWMGFLVGVLLFQSSLASAEWKSSVNGDATFEGLYWSTGTLGPDDKRARPIGTLKIPATIKQSRSLKFRFLPIVQSDPLAASRNEQFYKDLQEGYVQLQFLPWTMQLGYNVQTWGDTDVFNPLDVVNARRYYDPFRSEKLGAATILIKREWEKFFAEFLFIPEQRHTLIPGENSRWLPREIYKSRSLVDVIGTGVVLLPQDLRYHYVETTELDNATKNNFGGRVKFRLPGFDWTLAGFKGAANAPAVNIAQISGNTTVNFDGTNVAVQVNPDVFLRPTFYQMRMLGTSFVLVAGDFLIKGASAHTKVLSQLSGSQLPKDTLENGLGIERTFSVGTGSLTALLQGTYVSRADNVDTNSVSLARMFDRAAMAGLRWAPSERVTALLSMLYDIHFKGNLEHGEVSYKIRDGWLGKIGADLLGGSLETPIGTYRRNDRVIASLNVQI